VALAMSGRITAPTDCNPFEPRNRLLATLPAKDLQSLQPHLATIPLAGGSVLSDTDAPLDRVYFVDAGVVSLSTAFEDRVTVGVAAVGREGAVGVAALLLGGDIALGRSRVLVSGAALAVEVSRLRSALRKSVKLRAACEASARGLLVQMLQSVPCNRLHTVQQRCARWLLMCADLTEGETFELSQECLAEMLGVPPSRSPGVVRELRHAGLIACVRGATTVLDRRQLEAVACECYRIVRNKNEGLLARRFD
jgi:CRP-like cAMP-binding protein